MADLIATEHISDLDAKILAFAITEQDISDLPVSDKHDKDRMLSYWQAAIHIMHDANVATDNHKKDDARDVLLRMSIEVRQKLQAQKELEEELRAESYLVDPVLAHTVGPLRVINVQPREQEMERGGNPWNVEMEDELYTSSRAVSPWQEQVRHEDEAPEPAPWMQDSNEAEEQRSCLAPIARHSQPDVGATIHGWELQAEDAKDGEHNRLLEDRLWVEQPETVGDDEQAGVLERGGGSDGSSLASPESEDGLFLVLRKYTANFRAAQADVESAARQRADGWLDRQRARFVKAMRGISRKE